MPLSGIGPDEQLRVFDQMGITLATGRMTWTGKLSLLQGLSLHQFEGRLVLVEYFESEFLPVEFCQPGRP